MAHQPCRQDFVASDELKNTLFFRRINSTKVHVTGIPKSRSKKSISSKLRLLLISGGIQSGSYVGIQRYIFDLLEILMTEGLENIDLRIVTGNQKQFRKQLTKE